MSDNILIFKNNNLPSLMVLKLFSQDIDKIFDKLKKRLKQAPMMFVGMQLIIDLSAFDNESELVLDTEALLVFLRGEGINPVAFMSGRISFREVLVKTKLGVLPVLQSNTKNHVQNNKTKPITEPRKTFETTETRPENTHWENKILYQPVRSGQRVYIPGDLTIIGAVSPGAEVIADGCIHIYGKLSGRAIAGAKGDEKAAIFCQSLDAELVSIAGNYKQLDDISTKYRHQRVQISLVGEQILFSSL